MGWLETLVTGRRSEHPAVRPLLSSPAHRADAALIADVIAKASPHLAQMRATDKRRPEGGGPRAWTLDPQDIGWNYMGDVPTDAHPGTFGLTYDALDAMARVSTIAAVHQTRINQVAETAGPQSSPYSQGMKVRLTDLAEKPTPASERRAREISKVLLAAGGKWGWGGLEPFVRALLRDSLKYDQANFEVFNRSQAQLFGRNAKVKPFGFMAVDAATIRRALPTEEAIQSGKFDPDENAYLQLVDRQVVERYSLDEMAFCVRRPRTWLASQRYGYPELEDLIRVITNMVNAETWNAVAFTNGVHASTILTVLSTMTAPIFASFKRQLASMLSGPRNAHRIPIVQLDPEMKEEIKPVSMSRSNRDMEFGHWVDWLVKSACALYQMDPSEINLVYGSEGGGGLFNNAKPAERVALSKERGLRPLLRQLGQWMTHHVVRQIDEAFCVEFIGPDVSDEEARVELAVKAIAKYKTVDEVRAEFDLPPIGGQVGQMILDPYVSQAMMAMAYEGETGADPEDTEYLDEAEDAVLTSGGEGFGKAGGALDELTLRLAQGADTALRKGRMVYPTRGGVPVLAPWAMRRVRQSGRLRTYGVEVL